MHLNFPLQEIITNWIDKLLGEGALKVVISWGRSGFFGIFSIFPYVELNSENKGCVALWVMTSQNLGGNEGFN